jgi:3-hydroxyisobutyrate dehydrogenase-like beta-hydroxyacid dehydrogenase
MTRSPHARWPRSRNAPTSSFSRCLENPKSALARELAARYVHFADAPVARTRQAAIDGTLSIMVGASPQLYARIEPLLLCMASDVTHCGPPVPVRR